MTETRRAFTLLELLVVIGIIAILAGLVLPSLSKARARSRTLVCLSHLRELEKGWQLYADENENVILPGRMYDKPGGKLNPENWYEVGNGLKYRPRWAATLGAEIGVFAFNEPLTKDKDGVLSDRQSYSNEVYQCPSASEWVDERNYAYGYNYQFLGNARQTNNRYRNFPVLRHQVKVSGGTVVAADSMGTAAGFGESLRGGYSKDGKNVTSLGNHGWSLDPPRLTNDCDRGTGEPGSPRTAVDPRHQDKANAVFADGHGDTLTPRALGYRTNTKGRYVDYDPNDEDDGGGDIGTFGLAPPSPLESDSRLLQAQPGQPDIDGAHNRLFSGTGRDDDPPALPVSAPQP